MSTVKDPDLLDTADLPGDNPDELDKFLGELSKIADDNAIDRVISLYTRQIKDHEIAIWNKAYTTEDISKYQNEFKRLEKLHQLKAFDERYNFKIVIPVADRPQHLKHCLQSLLYLCQHYEYGGIDKSGSYQKISVMIADDSKDQENINRHIKLCKKLTDSGIRTDYFGLQEQIQLVKQYNTSEHDLTAIISSVDRLNSPYDFSHKGASIMRNISYLKLNQEMQQDIEQLENTLIYFIDSDQEFCINNTQSDDKSYAINYFHYLNDIFKTQDISILTGKVVGDPPVSPAVMAGNFQQDIINFIDTIKDLNPDDSCNFHQLNAGNTDDAAYHDMANLFGFSKAISEFDYHCTLQNEHSNSDCFDDFSARLGHFFYGEHPTRKTYFSYGKGFSETIPARTVYTGNYVIKPESLKYFIPFATLKLRMAGPALGRILKEELSDKFVSANLPMLHNRTVEDSGQSEYRSGVKNKNHTIDLSNEFIRQFYGDVMLFTLVKLTEGNTKLDGLSKSFIHKIVLQTYETMKQYYEEKHCTILSLKSSIKKLVDDPSNWWNANNHGFNSHNNKHGNSLQNINNFLDNIQKNFDDNTLAYLEITTTDKVDNYLNAIIEAIFSYRDSSASWHEVLKRP